MIRKLTQHSHVRMFLLSSILQNAHGTIHSYQRASIYLFAPPKTNASEDLCFAVTEAQLSLDTSVHSSRSMASYK